MAKEKLSHEYILSILDYNKDTGVFVWRARTPDMFRDGKGRYTKENNCKAWNKRYAGKIAGHVVKQNNRTQIRIHNVLYCLNIIAWFYVHGVWPDVDVDHKDRKPDNNSIENLRLATNSQNGANKTKYNNNSTGYKGVSFHKTNKRFAARIKKDGKQIHLGYFDTAEEAHEAYCKAARELFGAFSCIE